MERIFSRMVNRMKEMSKMENKAGGGTGIQMAMCMKGSGRMISKMEREPCGIPTKISMMESGKKARKTVLASIFTTMEPFTKEIS